MTDPYFAHLDSFIQANTSQADSVALDLGAGDGAITNRVAEADIRTVALDIDPVGLRLASSRHRCVLGDVHQLPFRDAVFHLALFTSVLEHIEDPDRALAELHRVLKPAGRLFLVVPCRKGIPRVFGDIYMWLAHAVMPQDQRLRHFHIENNYSFKEIAELLERHSFRLERVTHSHFVLTSLLAGNYPWSFPFHVVFTRIVEALHLTFLMLNSELTCVSVPANKAAE